MAAEKSTPELASITFFCSGVRLSYLAWFMAMVNSVVYRPGCGGLISEWYLVISCSFMVGTTSQGST